MKKCNLFLSVFFLLGMLVACRSKNITLQPPSPTSTRLLPQFQLTFERSGQDWLRTADGHNLIAHGVISDPTILYEDGRYRMWFTAAIHPYTDQQELGTAYAESEDGLIWHPRVNPETGDPLLVLRPTPAGWDAAGVETPSVLKRADGKYLLYYTGTFPPEGTNSWGIGLAISDDGLIWTKVGDDRSWKVRVVGKGHFLRLQRQRASKLAVSWSHPFCSIPKRIFIKCGIPLLGAEIRNWHSAWDTPLRWTDSRGIA